MVHEVERGVQFRSGCLHLSRSEAEESWQLRHDCVTVCNNGQFKVKFPVAGMYWLETGTEDNKTSIPQANVRRLS